MQNRFRPCFFITYRKRKELLFPHRKQFFGHDQKPSHYKVHAWYPHTNVEVRHAVVFLTKYNITLFPFSVNGICAN